MPLLVEGIARMAQRQPQGSGVEIVKVAFDMTGHASNAVKSVVAVRRGGKGRRSGKGVCWTEGLPQQSRLLSNLPPSLRETQTRLWTIAQVSNVLQPEKAEWPVLRYTDQSSNTEPSTFIPVRVYDNTLEKRSPRMLALLSYMRSLRIQKGGLPGAAEGLAAVDGDEQRDAAAVDDTEADPNMAPDDSAAAPPAASAAPCANDNNAGSGKRLKRMAAKR